jgi:hypothetical protein
MSWVLEVIPIILATHEAEIRRISVRSQPWANSLRSYPKILTQNRAGRVAQVVRAPA